MDEIVFTREQMRREMVEHLKLLDKAADSYDPEADAPTDDMIAASLIVLSPSRTAYLQAITHRVDLRSAERKARGDAL